MTGSVRYFNPTKTTGPDGYINYKMSGGDKLGSGGGSGCGGFVWFIIIMFVLMLITKF